MTRAEIEREVADLEAAQRWGQEHPYAGVCGEDDALADTLDYWRLQLALCPPDAPAVPDERPTRVNVNLHGERTSA